MVSLGNITPEMPELPRSPAQVIDILTGAPASHRSLMPAMASMPSAVLEFEEAAWAIVRGSQDLRERAYEAFKRTIDVVGSAVLLIALAPLFALIAVLVKVTLPGPVFFRQVRLGRHGRPFRCIKFRTMVPDAEQRLQRDPLLRAAFENNYKIKDDPRVSPLGALLRRTSLDEVPQLWNVLRGDMSLIGPRPVVPPELAKYGTHSQKLLSVPPGLSGLWQTCGRSDTTYEQRVRFDMLYIDHRSAWLDTKLIFLTIAAVCRRVGAC
jgi:lipopolysaccharide/colanic/teichoic acid biosynthesis glycosyltransferase